MTDGLDQPPSPAQWEAINELFDRALDRPLEERRGFVRFGAAGDLTVEREVLALLAAHDSSGSFLDRPIANLPRLASSSVLDQMGKPKPPPRLFQPGERLGDFEIIRLAGQGAFAHVYLARQLSLERYVALKVASGTVGREARTMAGLEHDYIVQVFSEAVIEESRLRVICMQFVPGLNLQQLIEKLSALPAEKRSGTTLLHIIDQCAGSESGPTLFNANALRDRENMARSDFDSACLWIGASLGDALAFAHARGILHLDVKPANVLVNRYGRPMLSDFNVSLNPQDIDSGTPEVVGGTLAYMSPEQFRAFSSRDAALLPAVDHRSDIYSLGMVVTELLTCAPVDKVTDEPSGTTILRGTESLPEEIASVLHVAMKIRPEDRFQSAGAFADALENCREIARIRRQIPRGSGMVGSWLNFVEKRPVLALVFVATAPQFLGSIVNITYNSVRIVSDLNQAQQDRFIELLVPYNLVAYPICTWLVWRQVAFLVRSLRHRRDRYMPNPKTMAVLRERVLATSNVLFAASSFGWLPGAVLFPLIIDLTAGPLPTAIYWHFLVSFVSSWLIALTYSFVLLEAVILQVLYPRFWTGCCDVRTSSRHELRRLGRRIKIFQILAGIIPLAGAVMIVSVGPDTIAPDRYRVFRVMVVGLIALGMCGIIFAMKTAENVKRTVAAFTNNPAV